MTIESRIAALEASHADEIVDPHVFLRSAIRWLAKGEGYMLTDYELLLARWLCDEEAEPECDYDVEAAEVRQMMPCPWPPKWPRGSGWDTSCDKEAERVGLGRDAD